MERLGLALRTGREQRGLTQQEVAVILGVSRPTVCMREGGKKAISALQLLKISQLLKIDLERLSLQVLNGKVRRAARRCAKRAS